MSSSTFLRNEIIEFNVPLKEEDAGPGTRRGTLSTVGTTGSDTSFANDSSASCASDCCEFPTTLTPSSDNNGVRFALDKTVRIPIEHCSELSIQEKRAVWYNQDAYDVINGSNNITAKLLKIGRKNPETYGYCYRGLEHRLPGARKDRDDRTKASIQMVLEQQAAAAPASVIKREYRYTTLSSLEMALNYAQQDEEAAKAYQEEYACTTPPPSKTTPSHQDDPACGGAGAGSCHMPINQNEQGDESEAHFEVAAIPQDDDDISILSDMSDDDLKDDGIQFDSFETEGKGLIARLKRRMRMKQLRRRGGRSSLASGSNNSVMSTSSASVSLMSASTRSSSNPFRNFFQNKPKA